MIFSEKDKKFFIRVYKNVALYSDKIKETGGRLPDFETNWNQLPLMEKEDYIAGSSSTIMPDKIPMMLSGKLMEVFTSGTSGTCMNVLWSVEDCRRALLSLWLYRKREYGVSPGDKYCYFYSARTIGREEKAFEIAKNQLGFDRNNLTEERLLDIYITSLQNRTMPFIRYKNQCK